MRQIKPTQLAFRCTINTISLTCLLTASSALICCSVCLTEIMKTSCESCGRTQSRPFLRHSVYLSAGWQTRRSKEHCGHLRVTVVLLIGYHQSGLDSANSRPTSH